MDNLGHKRKSYELNTLNKEDLSNHPIQQFQKWFDLAEKEGVSEPNAMSLATVSSDHSPSVRIVLLKGFGERGLAFYTNYQSHKGQQLLANPKAAVVFWWDKIQCQIRVEGLVSKLSEQESEKYFHSRPRGSQLSAVASPQSAVITKHELIDRRIQTEEKFKDIETIPKPSTWGGYVLKPHKFEFWQGRANRYHDRFEYFLSEDGRWNIHRLAP